MTHSRSTEKAWADPEKVAYRENHVPLRRLAQPEDVGAAVSFLVGPQGRYVTGENLNVDGGLRLVTMEGVVPPGTNYIAK